MKTVFEFQDYREFLKHALPIEGEQRGSRNRLAEFLNCQKGFVSQVLGGRSHFSLEHGARISRFLKLDPSEEEYFLLLLHLGRAGSKELERFYENRLKEISNRRKEIQGRIRSRSDLSESEQMTYYSSWHYTAIHMCLFSPKLRERNSIAEYLGLSPSAVVKVLEFLTSVGLAKQSGSQFVAGPARIHLPHHSPLISKHHSNWRMKAIDSLDGPKESDLHYSLVMSISPEAAEQIRRILLNAVQEVEPVLKAAQDEGVYTLNLDLFCLER